MSPSVNRRVTLSTVLLLALVTSGCLTLQPTVSGPPSDAAVFESVSTDDPWSSGHVTASVALAPNATTDRGVTELTVIDADGAAFDTQPLESGQTTTTLFLPTDRTVTLVATNTVNGTVVETIQVRTGGNTVV